LAFIRGSPSKNIAAAPEFIRPILHARDIAFPLQLCGPMYFCTRFQCD
jgi:hypothetical protein